MTNGIEQMNISTIKPNPSNPRIIKDDKFKKLVQSIKDFPEMLKLRPIIIDNNNMVLGGNMRLRACQELKMKGVPVVRASELTEKQKKEFIIKDNASFGEWDWNVLVNDWNEDELNEWGLDVPALSDEEEAGEHEIESQFFLNVKCENESECQRLYEKFTNEGLNVKIIT